MKKLDSNIVKIQKIMRVSNLITEASKKDVLVNKIGLSEELANYFDEKCGGLAVIMFKKMMSYLKDRFRDFNTNYNDKDIIDIMNKNKGPGYTEKERLQSIMDWVRVGLNGRLNQYQDLGFYELYEKSKEWHDSLNLGQGDINYKEENDIIKDFRDEKGNGFYWADLNTNSSDEECKRMGHCGRTGSNNNLYSLREQRQLPGGKFSLNKSHLTASIGNDGTLYQLKGPKNSKPQEEYHKYILPLFFVLGGGGEQEDYLIQGFGSEYASNLDFKITDLPDDTIKELYTQRPELFSGYSLRKKLRDMGLIEMPSFGEFILEIPTKYIDNYVGGDFVTHTRRWTDENGNKREKRTYFFEALLTDPWDFWDNWDNQDWKSALEYYVDKENEKKIRDYLMSLAENPSEYEDISLEEMVDELDDDNQVQNALMSAANDCERDDYVNALQEHMKELLELYGDVIKLDDQGAEIKVDLENFIDNNVENDEWLFEVIDNCGEKSSECIFSEIISDYGFDKPKWNFDDRFIPDVDERLFNEVLSDRLSDFIKN